MIFIIWLAPWAREMKIWQVHIWDNCLDCPTVEDHFFNSALMIVHVALPYIFTERILRKKSFLHPNGFRRNFIAGTKRAIPSWLQWNELMHRVQRRVSGRTCWYCKFRRRRPVSGMAFFGWDDWMGTRSLIFSAKPLGRFRSRSWEAGRIKTAPPGNRNTVKMRQTLHDSYLFRKDI